MATARVLIVDDEDDILVALKTFLEGALGLEVVAVPSGAAGLEELAKRPVDLIVSDYRMPGMDGMEFLRRAAQAAPGAPRVLLTAFPDMQLAITALNEARISRFLTKPVEPEKLAAILEELLSASRRRRLSGEALDRSVGKPKDAGAGKAAGGKPS